MGAWGPAVFSDDTALDVRSTYRELIEDGVDDAEAQAQVLARYREAIEDPDDGPVVWLALAVTQSKVGRLDPGVAARALGVIDRGEGLDRWAEDRKLLARRQSALDKARDQLTGPQPPRKRLRPPKKRTTNLTPGDLLVYRAHGLWTAIRVSTIDSGRYGDAPVLIMLDYLATVPPSPTDALPDREHFKRHPLTRGPEPAWRNTAFQPSLAAKVDDYLTACELGFEKVGSLPPRPGDQEPPAWRAYGDWLALTKRLDRYIGLSATT